MKYEILYYKFINKFSNQTFKDGEYTEVHHILPKYLGGGNESSNLIRLTFRQHVLVHHLWARATDHQEAWIAYKMMSGNTKEGRLLAAKLGGLKNKESGWIDKIRPLANTPERQRKLAELNQYKVDNELWREYLGKAWEKLRGSKQSPERLRKRSEAGKKKYKECPKNRADIQRMLDMAHEKIQETLRLRMEEVYRNAIRDEEWLHKKSLRSKNHFVSGEGLVFDSPIFAAKYYGEHLVKYYDVENWCKTNRFGWKRVLKTQ